MGTSLCRDAQSSVSAVGSRRSRARGSVGGKGSNGARVYESAGPDVKIKGDAAYIADKYTALEREARANGNWVLAEEYAQHAEHYRRLREPPNVQSASRPFSHPGATAENAAVVASENLREGEEAPAEVNRVQSERGGKKEGQRRYSGGSRNWRGTDRGESGVEGALSPSRVVAGESQLPNSTSGWNPDAAGAGTIREESGNARGGVRWRGGQQQRFRLRPTKEEESSGSVSTGELPSFITGVTATAARVTANPEVSVCVGNAQRLDTKLSVDVGVLPVSSKVETADQPVGGSDVSSTVEPARRSRLAGDQPADQPVEGSDVSSTVEPARRSRLAGDQPVEGSDVSSTVKAVRRSQLAGDRPVEGSDVSSTVEPAERSRLAGDQPIEGSEVSSTVEHAKGRRSRSTPNRRRSRNGQIGEVTSDNTEGSL